MNEVYVEAKSWVHVTQVPSKIGGGASFATTKGDGIMRFNRKKGSPNNPNPNENDNGKKNGKKSNSSSGNSDTKKDNTTTGNANNPPQPVATAQADSQTNNGLEVKTKDLSKF